MSTPEVAIEPMTEADVAAVLAIDLSSFPPDDVASGHGDPPDARARQLREELGRAWARLRVARERPGELSGYVLFWHVADEIHLLNVAVAPSSRRRGIGRVLVEEVRRYAREHGAAKILLEVRAGNAPALGLYESLGFERFNVRPRYYRDGEDAVEMMFSL
jgi:ribosomal-protein-alanine N-acetyltransferase